MDSITTEQYRSVVEQLLTEYAKFLHSDDVQMELIFDREHDRYLLVKTGWQKGRRIYGTLLHLDIIEGKVWIQHDGTEEGVALELTQAGIPKDRIVLGFKSEEQRWMTEFAIT